MIKKGRNILSEVASERAFNPNDYVVYNFLDSFDNDFESPETEMINKYFSNRFMLISGPNFSGKSVYLKQVIGDVFLIIRLELWCFSHILGLMYLRKNAK